MPSEPRPERTPQSLDDLEQLLHRLPAPSVPSGLEAKLLSQIPSAGQLRPPADPAQRVRRALWRQPAVKIGLAAAGLAAILCLGMALGWFAHRSTETGTGGIGGADIRDLPVETRYGPEAKTACNVLRVDPVARTVTIIMYHPPNGREASTEVRTFALAADCRIVMDGKATDLQAMTAGQPVVDYVVTDGSQNERLASLNVKQ